MSDPLTPSEKDVKTVLEAHNLLPEGPMLEEALNVLSLYSDRIQELLAKIPPSADKHKALLAIIEEGLMQEGFIPSSQGRRFETDLR
jgi:hypothetical protein